MLNRTLRGLLRNDGFTVVEMMVAMTLSTIAIGVLVSVFVSTQTVYSDTRATVANQGDARAVVNLMTQELRSAGSNPDPSLNVQRIPLAHSFFLRVQSDINGDGVLQGVEPAEDIIYFYLASSSQLWRITGTTFMAILNDVDTCTFEYRDAAGNVLGPLPLGTAERDQVRSVRLVMTQSPPLGEQQQIDTVITMRNDS